MAQRDFWTPPAVGDPAAPWGPGIGTRPRDGEPAVLGAGESTHGVPAGLAGTPWVIIDVTGRLPGPVWPWFLGRAFALASRILEERAPDHDKRSGNDGRPNQWM